MALGESALAVPAVERQVSEPGRVLVVAVALVELEDFALLDSFFVFSFNGVTLYFYLALKIT